MGILSFCLTADVTAFAFNVLALRDSRTGMRVTALALTSTAAPTWTHQPTSLRVSGLLIRSPLITLWLFQVRILIHSCLSLYHGIRLNINSDNSPLHPHKQIRSAWKLRCLFKAQIFTHQNVFLVRPSSRCGDRYPGEGGKRLPGRTHS